MPGEDNMAAELDLGRVVNALPAPVWTTQGDGRCDFVNRHWCEYTGLSADTSLDHGWHSAIHPDDLRPFLDCWSVIQQSGVAQEIDGRLRRSDGEYRWFVFRPSMVEDVGGRGRWCWLGLYADESTTTDGRLRRLWDVLPWQAGFLNTAGVLEFTNLQSLKDFGMSHLELEQWRTSGIIHADDHEKNWRSFTTLMSTGEMHDVQIRMHYPDGAYRWTRARCVPVRDAQGNVVRYVTFQIDVDDLKQAEDLLAAEVKVLEKIARGEPLKQVLAAVTRHVEELCDGGFPRARQQDLNDRFAKIAGIAIERDRAETASKVTQEALNQARLELAHVARTATLSAMTASITHEVAQPISGILTNSNTCARALAADPPNLAKAAEAVRRTIRDANRASEVVKRLRAMFAKKAPTLEMVDLNEAAQEVIAMSQAELRRSGSLLQTDFAEPLPVISGDRVQLQQVILNLLLNAADAMAGIEDRSRTLRVQTQIDRDDSVKLLVQDCGIGLDPLGIEKLFEPFHTTKPHGLGIGLAISRTIIESHKGKLWGAANDGPGATFGFSIPCVPGAAPGGPF